VYCKLQCRLETRQQSGEHYAFSVIVNVYAICISQRTRVQLTRDPGAATSRSSLNTNTCSNRLYYFMFDERFARPPVRVLIYLLLVSLDMKNNAGSVAALRLFVQFCFPSRRSSVLLDHLCIRCNCKTSRPCFYAARNISTPTPRV
jgi:hypothetical protein